MSRGNYLQRSAGQQQAMSANKVSTVHSGTSNKYDTHCVLSLNRAWKLIEDLFLMLCASSKIKYDRSNFLKNARSNFWNAVW